MLSQFYLAYENDISSSGIKAIQYNIHKRIKKLKYVSYKRIDILFTFSNPNIGIEIHWDDKKTANIICYLDNAILNNLADKNNIISTYEIIFNCIKALWRKNEWNLLDLV